MAHCMQRVFDRCRQQNNGSPSSEELQNQVVAILQGASPYLRPPREESGWVAVPWPFYADEVDEVAQQGLPGDERAEVLLLPDMQWYMDAPLPHTAFSCEKLGMLDPPPHPTWWDAAAALALRPGRRIRLRQFGPRAPNGLAHVFRTVGSGLLGMELSSRSSNRDGLRAHLVCRLVLDAKAHRVAVSCVSSIPTIEGA